MHAHHWTSNGDGVLTSRVGSCRLKVATIGGMPRFLVYDEAPGEADGQPLLRASGTRPAIAEAMADAETVGRQISGLGRRDGRSRR